VSLNDALDKISWICWNPVANASKTTYQDKLEMFLRLIIIVSDKLACQKLINKEECAKDGNIPPESPPEPSVYRFDSIFSIQFSN
jgi:hypothetical protein